MVQYIDSKDRELGNNIHITVNDAEYHEELMHAMLKMLRLAVLSPDPLYFDDSAIVTTIELMEALIPNAAQLEKGYVAGLKWEKQSKEAEARRNENLH